MIAGGDARARLAKAREFLESARVALDLELLNAATSHAVIAGINAKDAICLRLTGGARKTESHSDAVAELRAAGPAGAAQAVTLGRLLRLKTRSQYQAKSVGAADAAKAVEWAAHMVAGAEAVVTSR